MRVTARALELNQEEHVYPILRRLLDEFNPPKPSVAPTFNGMVPMVSVGPVMTNYEDGRILLRFMRHLPEKMQGDGPKTLAAFPKIRELYRNFVTVYFDRAVGKEPLFVWSRPGAAPSTGNNHLYIADRAHLTTFLQDPHYIEGRFPLAGYRQRKLMNHVPPDANCRSSLATGYLTVRKLKGGWETERMRWAENCKSFVAGIKQLGETIALEAVLGPETYASTVLRPEQRASEEPAAEGPDDREQVPPHMVYEWDGSRVTLGGRGASAGHPAPPPLPPPPPRVPPSYGRPPGAQTTGFVLNPFSGQGPAPLWQTAGNVLPQPTPPVAGTKRKADENMLNTDRSREAVKRKVGEAPVLDLTED
ncbi:hypothetical protein SLS54_004342 [Diplodia seriata]